MIKTKNNKQYDLEERTAKFGESVIEFTKGISRNPISNPLISQLVRAGTSVGANYCEANNAQTKKEFIHKIGICKKEAKETQHWLRMISKADEHVKEKAKLIWKETQELILIFSTILSSCRKKKF